MSSSDLVLCHLQLSWDVRSEETAGDLGLVLVGVSKNTGTPEWMVYNGKPY